MDNMLYIIAGLVLIVLVAVFFLRKNKTQNTTSLSPTNTDITKVTPTPKVDYGTSTHENTNDDNKFDHVTIAQRFMEQQRYDKAIETLKRGLAEKPNDGALSVKLLSVYATINQTDNFDSTYQAIKTQNDAHTITLADEIKNLYLAEQSPAVDQKSPVEDTTNFESIDFDLPTNQTNESKELPVPTVSEDTTGFDDMSTDEAISSPQSLEIDNISATSEQSDDSFDLTLSDLESDFDDLATTNDATATPIATASNDAIDSQALDSHDSTDINIDDSEILDFDFGIDTPEEAISTETPTTDNTSNSEIDTSALEDDAFILDFDDLAADSETNQKVENTADDVLSSEGDFDLSLEDLDESISVDEPSTAENNNELDDFVFEDSVIEDTSLDSTDAESANAESNVIKDIVAKTTVIDDSFADIDLESFDNLDEVNDPVISTTESVDSLRFDDHTVLDDEAGLSEELETNASTAAPVETQNDISTSPLNTSNLDSETDFASRFAADFDFVKSLDSNQVTLDLAEQYLQLGEYDSAKRLLNEVIAQGNSEQQDKAQILLDRTA